MGRVGSRPDIATPASFTEPTVEPRTDAEMEAWQQANRRWWESHPMCYDWKEAIDCEELSPEFYREIDRRFFSNVAEWMPWKRLPFDALIDFDSLPEQDVLEIGVGSGSHAGMLARHARSFTGIDISDYAVDSVRGRFRWFGLEGTVERMDAEQMTFEDESFDYVWSWGVIHHSASTARVLKEIQRVLRPEGRATMMVYHRGLWNYYIQMGLLFGLLRGELLHSTLHQIVQRHTDGAIARYFSITEWRRLASPLFEVERIRVMGQKTDVIPLPSGKAKQWLKRRMPDRLTSTLTNRCRMGGFLISTFRKSA